MVRKILLIMMFYISLPSVVLSQSTTLVTDFRSSVFGGASWGSNCKGRPSADGTEVILSDYGKNSCAGTVLVTAAPICASEYIVSFEFSSSNPLATGDIAVEEILHRPEGYTSADLDHAIATVVNRTYYFSITNSPAGMLYGNNFNLSSPPVNISQATTPFSVRGKGWQHMSAHIVGSKVSGLVSSGFQSAGLVGDKLSTVGRVKYPYIVANTIVSDSVKIRNLKVQVLKEDDCTGSGAQLTVDQTKTRLVEYCVTDDCTVYDTFLTCATTVLDSLVSDKSISDTVYNSVLGDIQVRSSYCSGTLECKSLLEGEYNKGFFDGVASIDQNYLKTIAYKQGYESGFSAGVSKGFEDCFNLGKNSVACPTPTPTTSSPDPTPTSTPTTPTSDSTPLSENKVTICHLPPGNTGNPNTITVGAGAVGAHLGHGDYVGECLTHSLIDVNKEVPNTSVTRYKRSQVRRNRSSRRKRV